MQTGTRGGLSSNNTPESQPTTDENREATERESRQTVASLKMQSAAGAPESGWPQPRGKAQSEPESRDDASEERTQEPI